MREADVERSDRLVESLQLHENGPSGPVDVRPAGLERQGPVALGQGLGETTGSLEDQPPLQVVAGQRRVVAQTTA